MKNYSALLLSGILSLSGFAARAQNASVPPLPPLPPVTVVTVSASTASTEEGGAKPGVFTIKRTGSTSGPLLVLYKVGGSASKETDYKRLPGSVIIPSGKESVDVQLVAVDDKVRELEENVILTVTSRIQPLAGTPISTVLSYSVGEPASAIVTIMDNDFGVTLPTVMIAATFPEASEQGPKNGEFTISRLGDAKAPLEVGYEIVTTPITSPDDLIGIIVNIAADQPIQLLRSAQNGIDYKQLSGTVTIPAGEPTAKILIKPKNDSTTEGREHVTLRLKTSERYNINPPTRATVLLDDNDPNIGNITVSIARPESDAKYVLGEAVAIAAVANSTQGSIKSVEFFANGKSIGLGKPNPAISSLLNPYMLTWTPDAPGTYELVAAAMDNEGRSAKSPAIKIIVSGAPGTSIVRIYTSVPEAPEGPLDARGGFTVVLNGAFKVAREGSLKSKLNVRYKIEGTASNGSDYKELTGLVTIPAGEQSAPIFITPIPDNILEGDETVTLTLQQLVFIAPPAPEDDYLVAEPSKATVTITERPVRNLPPKASIEQPKNGESFPERTTIKVVIQVADADGYVPHMELYDGLKLIDSETRQFFVKPPPGQIESFVFEWKDVPAGEHVLVAKATDDGGQSATSSAVKIVVKKADADIPVVTVVASDAEASESDTKNIGIFKIVRTGSAQNALNVHFMLSGTAQNGVDYSKLPEMVVLPKGKTSVTLDVKAISDKAIEGKEIATLTLVQLVFIAPPGPEDNFRVGEPRAASVTIIDGPTPNPPPKIVIITPKSGAEFPAGSDIVVEAEASAASGKIAKILFFANDKEIEQETTLPYRFTWHNVGAGDYVLVARATDTTGAVGYSEPVKVIVKRPVDQKFVTRELPDTFSPGEAFKVLLVARPSGDTQVYAVEDHPPKGWSVGSVSDGGVFDESTGEVKFGPYIDGKPRTLVYEIKPPVSENPRPQEFNGSASADGIESVIGGDHLISPGPTRHPADIAPADNKITLNELTSYILAWKKGEKWSVGPNPIPQNYVTRAGEIWRRGETYTYDPSQGAPPLCWIPKAKPGVLSLHALEHDGPPKDVGRASRTVRRTGTDATLEYVVSLVASPRSGIDAYTIEEHAPAGSVISDVTGDGSVDGTSSTIRWGIFFGDKPQTLTYRVEASANGKGNSLTFTGVASFDGSDEPIRTGNPPLWGRTEDRGKVKGVHRHDDGECEVSLSAEPGRRYRIQTSDDLVNWNDFGTVTAEGDEVQMIDPSAKGLTIRYYRAIEVE